MSANRGRARERSRWTSIRRRTTTTGGEEAGEEGADEAIAAVEIDTTRTATTATAAAADEAEEDEAGGGRGRGRRDDGALSFRDFCYKYLRDDTTPAEAERRYEEYKKENQEAFYERYFRDHRHDEGERARNDPRVLVETLKRRDELACARAHEFFASKADGSLEIYGEGDAEGKDADMGEGEHQGEHQQEKRRSMVPMEAWHPTRLGTDYKQTGRLIAALDAEKGIDNNPLLDGDEDAGMDVEAAEDDAAALEALGNEASTPEKLDERLCYLIRVHGVDYYRRVSEVQPVTFLEKPYAAFAKRDPKPEDMPVSSIEQNPYAVRLFATVDAHAKRRIAEGDPQGEEARHV